MKSLLDDIAVISETEDYVVINKPAGLIVHGNGKKQMVTLVDWVLARYPDISDVGEPARLTIGNDEILVPRPGIVHRLDADTSGVMVIAKTSEMFVHLKQQFHDRLTQKSYITVVHGTFRLARGTVDAPIGDAAGGVQIKTTGSKAKGTLREAVTTYRVISSGTAHNLPLSCLECVPKTGRTHQIRVHMKHVGHPVVSDPLYCSRPILAVDKTFMPRLALHAAKLTFSDLQGKIASFSAPLPSDIDNLVKSLENS